MGYRLFLQGLLGKEGVRYTSADVTGNAAAEGSLREELALNVPIGSWRQFAETVSGRPVLGTESS